MPKLTLTTIATGYGSVDALNANFDAIETAIENTLSRDGTSPNTMSANLDMNSNRILNLPAPSNANEPARLQDVQDAVAGGSATVITFSPTGNIAATNVQAAIAELDTEKQPLDATLTALAGVSTAADKLIYATGSDAFSTTDLSTFARTLLDDTTASAARTTLGAVGLTGDETVAGIKTFSSLPVLPASTPSGLQAASAYAAFRKNLIIGGNFTTNPWQRGTSFTNLANGVYGPDRFLVERSDDAAVNVLKTADSPTAAEAGIYSTHCLHADVTTADASIAAGQSYRISQRIEGLNIAHMGFGQSGTRYLTLSFWHKHTKTGTYCVGLYNSAANRSYVAEYTQDVSDTWEKATVTFAVDTSGTWLYDTGIGLYINWTVAAGSTFHITANTWTAGLGFSTANQVNGLDSTSNNFKLALIQLEAGTVATEFENLLMPDVLALCQRYYIHFDTGGGSTGSFGFSTYGGTPGGTLRWTITLPVEMRALPTVTKNGTWRSDNCAEPTIDGYSTKTIVIGSSSDAAGVCNIYIDSADDTLTASAEL